MFARALLHFPSMIVDSKSFRVMKKWIVRNSIKDERDIRLLPFLSIEFSERVNNKRNRKEFIVRNKIDFFISCLRVTRLPGGKLYKDTRKEIRFEQRELSLPTTSRYPVWLFIGSVLIWHMYHPLSDSFTSRMWRNHVRWSLWETAIRWFFVITWLAIVNIVWVSTRSHATCNKIEKTLLVSHVLSITLFPISNFERLQR